MTFILTCDLICQNGCFSHHISQNTPLGALYIEICQAIQTKMSTGPWPLIIHGHMSYFTPTSITVTSHGVSIGGTSALLFIETNCAMRIYYDNWPKILKYSHKDIYLKISSVTCPQFYFGLYVLTPVRFMTWFIGAHDPICYLENNITISCFPICGAITQWTCTYITW